MVFARVAPILVWVFGRTSPLLLLLLLLLRRRRHNLLHHHLRHILLHHLRHRHRILRLLLILNHHHSLLQEKAWNISQLFGTAQVKETLKIVLRKFSKMKKLQTTRYLRALMVQVVVYY
jgi:GTP-binding protein EngB required for normal cell division